MSDRPRFEVTSRQTGAVVATDLSTVELVERFAKQGERSASMALVRYLKPGLTISFGPEVNVTKLHPAPRGDGESIVAPRGMRDY